MVRIKVLVGRVDKCCCYPSTRRNFKGKNCSDLIKNVNSLLMIKESLSVLNPCYTKIQGTPVN